MSPELNVAPSLQDTPTVFPCLARLRERLVTEYLLPLLDKSRQTWYLQVVALLLTQSVLALYCRLVLQIIHEQGYEALSRVTRKVVTIVPLTTGSLTVQVNLETVGDGVPVSLTHTLSQRYQSTSWHLLAKRLALDLTTAALESLQQTVGPEGLTAMSEAALTDAMLGTVLQTIHPPLYDHLHSRLEVQAQYDALDLANLLETRAPSLLELEYLLGVRQSSTRPARLLGLLRQEHFTVLSAAHYHAIRAALAHNTFQEVEGIPVAHRRTHDRPSPRPCRVTSPGSRHYTMVVSRGNRCVGTAYVATTRRTLRSWMQICLMPSVPSGSIRRLTPQDDAVADIDELLAHA